MLRKLTLAVTGAALALGVLVIPASAVSPPEVLEVNALPNTKIELCSAGVERRSIKYGRAAADWAPTAGVEQRWVIRKASPGKCTGTRLARFKYTFEEGQRYTVAYWKDRSGPRMSVWVNSAITTAPTATSVIVRHVAHARAADIWIWQKVPTVAIDDDGATFHGLGRGDSSPAIMVDPYDTMVAAFPKRATRRWHSAFGAKRLEAGKTYQAFLMGDRQSNMKIKLFTVD